MAAALGPLRASAEKVRARTGDALAALLAQPGVDASRIAAIGFCFGGTMAFELALASAEKVRARTGDALAALLAQPGVDASRIAAIGFCFGGTMAFELALAGADIKAAIGFHSGLEVTSPQDAGKIRGKVMALLGAEDPGIPADQREAFHRMLTDAGVDWQMSLYG